MSELVTVDRQHPEFDKYLLGTFAKESRAIPVRSLNVSSPLEKITFEIKSLNEILRPHPLRVWAQTAKIKNIFLVLAPLIVTCLTLWQAGPPESLYILILAFLGASCLFISANLRSEFFDHVRGLDRIDLSRSSHSIQLGWLAAYQVRKAANLFLVLGIMSGLPVVFYAPHLLWLGAFIFLIGVWEFSSSRLGFKYRAGGEFLAFWLFGPLLTGGMAMALHAELLPAIYVGFVSGWLTTFVLHCKNLQKLLISSQAGVSNWVTRWGFEKSKKGMSLWLLLSYIIVISTFYLQLGEVQAVIIAAVQFPIVFLLLRRLNLLKSCLSSELKKITQLSLIYYYFVFTTWLVIQGLNLYYANNV